MYTIIAGTNRPNSNTLKVAIEYSRLLKEREISHKLLSLEDVDVTQKSEAFTQLQANFLWQAQKIIIIMPEYNGSYPGILKLLIDNSDIAKSWHHKKVLLTGVATGRAGNLRGMEHLTGALLHMKMIVHPNRLPISLVDKLLDINNQFSDVGTLNAINTQLDEFIKF